MKASSPMKVKYTGKAKLYSEYRPSYPNELIEYLYSIIGFSETSSIADIGAGTGKFTKSLLDKGSFVYCIEPDEEMLEVAKANLAVYPNCIFINCAAENTSLSDIAVDYVTVAQAYHWFDSSLFCVECKRILKINGEVVLIWNYRDPNHEIVLKTEIVNRKYYTAYKGFSIEQKNRMLELYSEFYSANDYKSALFNSKLCYDEDSFIGRNLSSSYNTLNQESIEMSQYVFELKNIFHEYSKNGLLEIPNTTVCYIGHIK